MHVVGTPKYQNINFSYIYFCDHCGTHCFIGLLLMRYYKNINSEIFESRTFSHLSDTYFRHFAMKLAITAFTHSPHTSIFMIESNLKSFTRQLQRGCGNADGGATRRLADGRRHAHLRVGINYTCII
jgi:hypothetical protein